MGIRRPLVFFSLLVCTMRDMCDALFQKQHVRGALMIIKCQNGTDIGNGEEQPKVQKGGKELQMTVPKNNQFSSFLRNLEYFQMGRI